MAYVALGAVGLLIGYAADLGAGRRGAWARVSLWALCFGIHASALALAALASPKFSTPGWAVFAGWTVLPVASFLLVYSLFLELPFVSTYAAGDGPPQLVTAGTYVLVRHPSVLWYLLLLAALLLVSRSWLLLAAAPLWAVLDIGWALLQERVVLAVRYAGYPEYQRTTPFLVPTARSLSRCLRGPLAVRSRRAL